MIESFVSWSAILAAVVIWLAICLYFLFTYSVYLGLFLEGQVRWRELAKKGRTLGVQQAREKIESGEGTLIVEATTLGWPVVAIWWAKEKVCTDTREGDETYARSSPSEIRDYERLIGTAGSAKLIRSFLFSRLLKRYIVKHFNTNDYLFIRSAHARMQIALNERD